MPKNAQQKPSDCTTIGLLRLLRPRLRPYRAQLGCAGGAIVLDAILTACRPWPLKVVIDRVISFDPRPSRVPMLGDLLDRANTDPMIILYACCAATVLIALSTGLLTYYFTQTLGDVGHRLVFNLRSELFTHMQRLSLRYHDRQRTGDLTSRLTSDIQAIQDIVSNGIIHLGSNGCLLAAMVVVMVWLNWQFALAALAVAPLLFWAVFRYTNRIRVAAREARVSDGILASVAQETLSSIRIVQGLAQEDQQSERFEAQNAVSLKAYLEGIRYQARVAPYLDVLAAVGLAVVMWFGAMQVRSGALTTGDVVVFFAYVTNLYSPMKALARVSNAFSKASVRADRIGEVMEERCEVTDRQNARPASRFKGSIRYQEVAFEYKAGQPILSGINLEIAPGERIALVGATGAGKSTLVSLVPRLYDPTRGAVWIDGEDIRNYSVQSLREQISLVLQDSLLLSGTIRDNIAFGRSSARDEEILAAAVAANADEFIRRLPDGYDTWVAERGTTLSGGEKQRIAIARAILRDSPILLLDEPTSGLDAVAEGLVIEAIERASKGRTTIMVAHRLTALRFANRIIVLDGGQVVEEGSHAALLAHNQRYASLYRAHQNVLPGQGINWIDPVSLQAGQA